MIQVETLFRQAVSAHLHGDLEGASSLYRRVLRIAPSHRPALNNLGAIHLQTGDRKAAAAFLEEAVRRDPGNQDAWNNLGVLYLESGDPARALACLKKALEVKPHDPEILTNLGDAHRNLGDPASARLCHQKAIEMDPFNPKAFNNLALVLKEEGDLGRAVILFRKALDLKPGEERFAFNLCEALVEAGALAEAVTLAEQALAMHPGSITTLVGAARVFIECGHWEKADPLLVKAAGYPYTPLELGVLRHLLLFLNASSLPRRTIALAHLRAGELLSRARGSDAGGGRFDFQGRFDGLAKIRIGYVSPDFNRHSVGWFFREIVGNHDTGRFEVYCYSLSERNDDVTEWIRDHSAKFCPIRRMTDTQAARRIFEDRIMILVDLAGYTLGNRLEIFACRPAPIQVTALGYPHGTGLPAMDYRISDPVTEGPSPEGEYREKLVMLDRFFLPLPQLPHAEPRVDREQLGIPPDAVVFASFNAFHKLGPEVLALWDRILQAAPGSRLLLSFRHSDGEYPRRRLTEHFHVPAERLHFLAQTSSEEEHRGRYSLVDLALDPFPYSGTTTSWEALSMGVPVITLKGDRHVQRTTFSLLIHLGVKDLSAEDPESYYRMAVDLAADPVRRAALKQALLTKVSQVTAAGNAPYVRELEKHYVSMCKGYSDPHAAKEPVAP
ncbi:MAG: tetratricopeptide repeat protein [Thermodesulfobacteriota bacterium]